MAPPFAKIVTKRILLLLIAYFACRVFFFAWNHQMYSGDTDSEITQAFAHGLLFDLSAILYTNAILLLIWLLPSRWLAVPGVQTADRILFGLINFICIGVNFIDVEFTRFIGKRFSYEYLLLHQDVEEQSFGLFLVYWKFFVGLFALTALVIWLYPRWKEQTREGWISGATYRLAFIALVILGMRGGFGLKPLHPMDAYFINKSELGLLTLNTPFNMIKTTPDGEVVTQRYFDNDNDAILRVKALTDPSRPTLGVAKNFNVVVLIVESLSTEDMGVTNSYPGFTPFLDSLSKKSFFFRYNFANSRRSIEGVPAVLCGIPAFMGEAIIMSDFMNNRLDCFPKILKQYGYSSYFLHGAYNGSFHFDTFSNIAGFEHFVGYNEFPDKREENVDPSWGIMDGPMLEYAIQVMDKAKEPVMLGLFTLSSHSPYYLPPTLRGKFPKDDNPIHESIGYADYSLRRFFEEAEKKPWFNHTIFVITGDHIHPSNHAEYVTSDQLGYYRVPLFIYVPGLKQDLKTSPDRITQHIDALPSVLDLLGIEKPDRFLLGQSVFDTGKPGRAYNYSSAGYWYIDSDLYLMFSRRTQHARVMDHEKTWHTVDRAISETAADALPQVRDIQAIAQYFNSGVLNNRFYDWAKQLKTKAATVGALKQTAPMSH